MRGYGQYCPIALGAEVFAERWTPIILRNLLVGCERFGEILEGAPGLPRSVLADRLRRLERDGVLVRAATRPVTYRLTECGAELAQVVLALGVWGARWREAVPESYDPYLMLWTLSRLINGTELPRPRVVVRFDLPAGTKPDRLWLIADVHGCEVCVTPPGFDEDGVVSTTPTWLYRWHTGRETLGRAVRAGGIQFIGPPWLERTLATWGRLSPFADVRPTAARSDS